MMGWVDADVKLVWFFTVGQSRGKHVRVMWKSAVLLKNRGRGRCECETSKYALGEGDREGERNKSLSQRRISIECN